MSQMELRVGRAIPILHVKSPALKDKSFGGQVELLQEMGYEFEEVDIDFEWAYCKQLAQVGDMWYHIDDKNYEEYGCVDGDFNSDGSINYVCHWYNGGASFEEVLESAIEKAKEKTLRVVD